MCFSAGASFTAAIGLVGPGCYAVAHRKYKGILAFAATPLLLSMHQTAEGFIWLSLKNPDFASWYHPALYVYSFISQPIWPIWVPFIIWLMETDKKRKKLLFYFLLLGAASSLYMFYCLINFNLSAIVENCHIRYLRDFPYLNIMRPINFVTIAVTPFLSTLRHMKVLSAIMLASLIVSYFFFTNYLISVWCFFAAILSVLMIWIVKSNNDPTKKPLA